MSKVLFVVPPYSSWGVEAIGTWPPLQVAYLAGAVEEAGHEACIFDAMNRDGADFESIRAEVARAGFAARGGATDALDDLNDLLVAKA